MNSLQHFMKVARPTNALAQAQDEVEPQLNV
jgi:hypothetical protein